MVALAGRLVVRRLWRTARRVHLGWGLLAMAAVLGPYWAAMLLRGGQEFRRLIYHEVFQRLTGAGPNAPEAASAPAVAYLLYYTLPASIFAVGAMLLAKPRRWLGRKAPLCLPLCWVLAVVVPFSLAHGFRPDYLLPCYAAVALLGAWAVEAVQQRRGRAAAVGALRHVFAGPAVTICLAVALTAGAFVFRDRLLEAVRRALPVPAAFAPETHGVLWALVPLGLAGAAAAVVWSLRWRVRRVAGLAVAAMLAVGLLHTHLVSRHARTGDGEAMLQFARRVRPIVGNDELAVYQTSKLSVELYLGRLGRPVGSLAEINRPGPGWLITCDRGLADLGACRGAPDGAYTLKRRLGGEPAGQARRIRLDVRPQELGEVRLVGRPVESQNWGRIYLVRLHRPVSVSGEPMHSAWESGKRDEDDEAD